MALKRGWKTRCLNTHSQTLYPLLIKFVKIKFPSYLTVHFQFKTAKKNIYIIYDLFLGSYTLPFKGLGSIRLFFFYYAHQGFNSLIKNTVILWNILLFKITVFFFKYIFNVIYSCDVKLNFQHHYSSLQCHMILQKSFSNMLIWQETFLIIINAENKLCLSNCFMETLIYFPFQGFFAEQKVQKNSIYLE